MHDATYIDTETTGLNHERDELRIVAIDGEAYDWWGVVDETHPQKIRDLLEANKHKTFVAFNAQFDLNFLRTSLGYIHEGDYFDPMVAYQILQCGRREPNGAPLKTSLDVIAKKIANVNLDKQYQKGPWDGLLDPDLLHYAAEDTTVLVELHERLTRALKRAGLIKMMQMEMQLLPVLFEASRKGVLVDTDRARQLVKRLEKDAAKLKKDIPDSLNPRAPAQVQEYFSLPDSEEDTMRRAYKKYGNPTLKNVMDVRKIYKKVSSINSQILKNVSPVDGRLHTQYKQTRTETGRLSSSGPNLQNQDRSAEVRSLFIPMDGYKFVIADYSQVELRLAALASKDRVMLKAYADGRDLHTETQTKIFGDTDKMGKEEKKKTRTLSKNINFGLVYGGGAGTLVQFAFRNGVEITEAEAKEYKRAFHATYPGLTQWQQRQGNTDPIYVYSMLGRRRYIEKGQAYCTRINHPIQSTAADGMKIAMLRLSKVHGILPLLNVHDELVIEVPEAQADEVCNIVEREMIHGMYRATRQDESNPTVRIVVEAGVASDWSEK